MKTRQKVGLALASGTMLAGAATLGIGIGTESPDFYSPAAACKVEPVHFDQNNTARRTAILATAFRSCFDQLPELYKERGELNSIYLDFPVAGGIVQFTASSEAPIDSSPAAYIAGVKDVTATMYQVATAKHDTQLESVDINSFATPPLYRWDTPRGDDGHYQMVHTDTDSQLRSYAESVGSNDYQVSTDPRVVGCVQSYIADTMGRLFTQVSSGAPMASLPGMPKPALACVTTA